MHRMASERHKYPPLKRATPATSGSDAENLNLNSSVLKKQTTKRVYQPATTQLSSLIKSKVMKIQKRNLKIDDALLVSSEESERSDVELTHPQKVDKLCYFIKYTLKLLSSLKNIDSMITFFRS